MRGKVFFQKDAVQVIGEILHEVYHCNIDLVLRLLSSHVHSWRTLAMAVATTRAP